MAGKLIVAGRVAPLQPWAVLGAAIDAATAGPLVTEFLSRNPEGRAIVASVVRSFAAVAQVTEDPTPDVQP